MNRGANIGPRVIRPNLDDEILLRAACLFLFRFFFKAIVFAMVLGTYWILDTRFERIMPIETMTIDGNYSQDIFADVDVLFDFDAWAYDKELIDEKPAEAETKANEESERNELSHSEKRREKDNYVNETPVFDEKVHEKRKDSMHPLLFHILHLHVFLSIREYDCGIILKTEIREFFDSLFKESDLKVMKLYHQGMKYIEERAVETERVCGWN